MTNVVIRTNFGHRYQLVIVHLLRYLIGRFS